jgi:hypothetical protein
VAERWTIRRDEDDYVAEAFLVFTGVHPPGTLGVAALLASDIGSLRGRVGAELFSGVVGVDFDLDTHEPVKTDLLTPLYRHDQA